MILATHGIIHAGFAYDPIAADYFARAGISDLTEKSAVNTLVLAIRANTNLYNAFLTGALYVCSPTSYGASLHNLMNSSYLLSATAAPSFATTGWTGNGSTQFLKTGIIPSTFYAGLDDVTVFCRRRDNAAASTIAVGVSSSTTSQIQIQLRRVGDIARSSVYTNATLFDVTSTNSSGNFFLTANGALSRKVRRNTTSLGTNILAHVGTNPTHEYYLIARDNTGTADSFSAGEYNGFGFPIVALSDSDCDAFSGLYDTYSANVISGGR